MSAEHDNLSGKSGVLDRELSYVCRIAHWETCQPGEWFHQSCNRAAGSCTHPWIDGAGGPEAYAEFRIAAFRVLNGVQPVFGNLFEILPIRINHTARDADIRRSGRGARPMPPVLRRGSASKIAFAMKWPKCRCKAPRNPVATASFQRLTAL